VLTFRVHRPASIDQEDGGHIQQSAQRQLKGLLKMHKLLAKRHIQVASQLSLVWDPDKQHGEMAMVFHTLTKKGI